MAGVGGGGDIFWGAITVIFFVSRKMGLHNMYNRGDGVGGGGSL